MLNKLTVSREFAVMMLTLSCRTPTFLFLLILKQIIRYSRSWTWFKIETYPQYPPFQKDLKIYDHTTLRWYRDSGIRYKINLLKSTNYLYRFSSSVPIFVAVSLRAIQDHNHISVSWEFWWWDENIIVILGIIINRIRRKWGSNWIAGQVVGMNFGKRRSAVVNQGGWYWTYCCIKYWTIWRHRNSDVRDKLFQACRLRNRTGKSQCRGFRMTNYRFSSCGLEAATLRRISANRPGV